MIIFVCIQLLHHIDIVHVVLIVHLAWCLEGSMSSRISNLN